jgi:hypothetical protein
MIMAKIGRRNSNPATMRCLDPIRLLIIITSEVVFDDVRCLCKLFRIWGREFVESWTLALKLPDGKAEANDGQTDAGKEPK